MAKRTNKQAKGEQTKEAHPHSYLTFPDANCLLGFELLTPTVCLPSGYSPHLYPHLCSGTSPAVDPFLSCSSFLLQLLRLRQCLPNSVGDWVAGPHPSQLIESSVSFGMKRASVINRDVRKAGLKPIPIRPWKLELMFN